MHNCVLCVCVSLSLWQALDALDRALQQNPSDLTVRAELYFSKGNQLREMNQLDRAFEVLTAHCCCLYFVEVGGGGDNPATAFTSCIG